MTRSKRIEIMLEMDSSAGVTSNDGGGCWFGLVLCGGVHRDPDHNPLLTVSRVIPNTPADRSARDSNYNSLVHDTYLIIYLLVIRFTLQKF